MNIQKIINGKFIYNVKDFIGEGASSRVYKGYNVEKSTEIAIKTFKKKIFFDKEMKKYLFFNHKNVVKLYEIDNTLGCMVFDFCDMTSLGEDMRSFTNCFGYDDDHLLHLISDVVDGMSYLKIKHDLVHRDLKPDNIFRKSTGLSDENVYGYKYLIGDLGDSCVLDESTNYSFLDVVGTYEYMHPKMLKSLKSNTQIKMNDECDMWSLAVVIFQCASGSFPYGKRTEVFKNVPKRKDGCYYSDFRIERKQLLIQPQFTRILLSIFYNAFTTLDERRLSLITLLQKLMLEISKLKNIDNRIEIFNFHEHETFFGNLSLTDQFSFFRIVEPHDVFKVERNSNVLIIENDDSKNGCTDLFPILSDNLLFQCPRNKLYYFHKERILSKQDEYNTFFMENIEIDDFLKYRSGVILNQIMNQQNVNDEEELLGHYIKKIKKNYITMHRMIIYLERKITYFDDTLIAFKVLKKFCMKMEKSIYKYIWMNLSNLKFEQISSYKILSSQLDLNKIKVKENKDTVLMLKNRLKKLERNVEYEEFMKDRLNEYRIMKKDYLLYKSEYENIELKEFHKHKIVSNFKSSNLKFYNVVELIIDLNYHIKEDFMQTSENIIKMMDYVNAMKKFINQNFSKNNRVTSNDVLGVTSNDVLGVILKDEKEKNRTICEENIKSLDGLCEMFTKTTTTFEMNI